MLEGTSPSAAPGGGRASIPTRLHPDRHQPESCSSVVVLSWCLDEVVQAAAWAARFRWTRLPANRTAGGPHRNQKEQQVGPLLRHIGAERPGS